VLLVLAACLPFLAVVVVRVATHWTPTQDLAVIDLRVRDVWSSDIPLAGAYSRFGWNHPGPVMFYALAVPSLLSGQAAWATLVGGVLFQAVAVVWLGRVSWKAGGTGLCFAFMLITTLSYASTGAWIVTEVWNPHLAFPWFILFVFYAWRLSLGETERLPGAIVASSVVAQLHVGYVYLLIAAVAAVSVSYWLDRRTGRRWSWPRRSMVIALILFVVLWLPVVLDAIVHSPGNLYEVVKFFALGGADGARNGLRSGLGLLGHEFTWPPQWITGQRSVGVDGIAIAASPLYALVPVALLAVGFVAARRSKRRDDARLLGVLTALVVYGIVALSRVIGDLEAYLFYWRIPLALLVIGAVVLACVHASRIQMPWGARSPAFVGLLAAVVVAAPVVSMTIHVLETRGEVERLSRFERSVDVLGSQLPIERLEGKRVLVRFEGAAWGGVEAGVIDWLDRHGVDVKVDAPRSFQFGEGRVARLGEVDETWTVLEEGFRTSLASDDDARTFVARVVPVGSTREASIVELQASLAAQLRAAGRPELVNALDSPFVRLFVPHLRGVSRRDVTALAKLNERVARSGLCRCSIVAAARP
jgi:hypothetical protein